MDRAAEIHAQLDAQFDRAVALDDERDVLMARAARRRGPLVIQRPPILKIPKVPRTREELPFELHVREADTHSPTVGGFCENCGADLKIARVRVADAAAISEDAKHLLATAVAAEMMQTFGGCDTAEQKALVADLTFDEREQLKELYCEGLEPTAVCQCGLDNVDLVGIDDAGTFLYATHPPFVLTPAIQALREAWWAETERDRERERA